MDGSPIPRSTPCQHLNLRGDSENFLGRRWASGEQIESALEAHGAIGMGGCVQGFLGSLLQPETGRAALARRIFCAPEVRWQAR